ncbi:hypothetical protein IAU60_004206 [Kwoniella sp. DSM 27419]
MHRRVLDSRTIRHASSSSSGESSSSSTAPRSPRRWSRYALTILGLTLPTSYLFYPSKASITPHLYSDQPVNATSQLTPQHKLVSVPIPSGSNEFFERPYRTDGTFADVDHGELVIQHMMIKSPDIQIERPYTPVNDATADGEVRMVVKRVRGGEVGRVVHNLKEGHQVGIRGPIPTMSIFPDQYDKIIMISTGTAVSPFLQLLSKLPSLSPSQSNGPRLHLIHAKPSAGRVDWAAEPSDAAFIPALQEKFGSKLTVSRVDSGLIDKDTLAQVLKGDQNDRIMVLVCLPPALMRPLCGGMTPNLDQGPLTGTLAELGLKSDQVWKLE